VGWALEQPGLSQAKPVFATPPINSITPSRALTTPLARRASGQPGQRPDLRPVLQADWLGLSLARRRWSRGCSICTSPIAIRTTFRCSTAREDRDIDWLFRTTVHRRRPVGRRQSVDRRAHLPPDRRAERTRTVARQLGQIQYFEDRRVNLYPAELPQTAANSA